MNHSTQFDLLQFPSRNESISGHIFDENLLNYSIFDPHRLDFVNLFPPELSEKLFNYLPIRDIFTCSKVCNGWRHILNNNQRWIKHCKQRGFLGPNSNPASIDPLNSFKSHVYPRMKYCESPGFYLPELASLRFEPICEWGLYFRQRLHLQRNWSRGCFVIHKMRLDTGYGIGPRRNRERCTSASCNGKFLIIGSSSGKVFIWYIDGIPKLCKILPMIRSPKQAIEIPNDIVNVKINNTGFLAILYAIGLVRIYNIPESFETSPEASIKLITQVRVCGISASNNRILREGYTLIHHEITEAQVKPLILQETPENLYDCEPNPDSETPESLPNGTLGTDPGSEDSETWFRDLLRTDPWFETEYLASDLIFLLNDSQLIVLGWESNCFIIFTLDKTQPVKKILLENDWQVSTMSYTVPNSLIVITRRARSSRRQNPEDETRGILYYHLQHPFPYNEYRSRFITNEIRIDPNNSDRVVWVYMDSDIIAVNIRTGIELFTKNTEALIDDITTGESYILYHIQDKGRICALNWEGETIYEIQSRCGCIYGLECQGNNYLVCGTDNMQFTVYDLKTGRRYHTAYNQPSRIIYLFVYETKIISIGREDPPVLTGYW